MTSPSTRFNPPQESFRFITDAKLSERFRKFHEENPHVYAELVRLARLYQAKGQRRGIGALVEIARYTLTTSGEEFNVNNSYRSRYARLIEAQEPDLRGWFEKRTLTTS